MDLRARVSGSPAEVVVTRGGAAESSHLVAVAVARADGTTEVALGDVSRPVFYRSAAKPLQALPLVEDGVVERLGLTEEELALCCASHNGEPRHVEVARTLLARAGVGEEALACGPHPPLVAAHAERLYAGGRRPGRIESNCSGKHAGMLALAAAHGWPTQGYHLLEHPVQQRMLAEVARWTGVPAHEIGTAVDGCGVVCFAVPLARMALSFARFAHDAHAGGAAARVVGAMTRHPYMVAGEGRLCTALMERAGERVFAKTGAEGVYCAGVPGSGIGVALKVLDGGRRAADAALLRVLGQLGVLGEADLEAIAAFARPVVRNTRGEVVGEVCAEFGLPAPAAAREA